MSKDAEIKPFRPEELPDQVKAFFSAIFALECEVAALKAEHIDPVSDEIKAKRRALKAGCDMNAKDIKLAYDLWKRLRQTENMEDEAEGQRVQADIRRIFAALQKGEMVDFLTVLGADEALKPLADDLVNGDADDLDGDNEFDGTSEFDGELEDVSGPKPLNLSPSQPRDLSDAALTEETAIEWDSPDETLADDSMDGVGFAFTAGRKAGETGALADANPHDSAENTDAADAWERGRLIGYRQYDAAQTQAEAAAVADDLDGESAHDDMGGETALFGDDETDGGNVVALHQGATTQPNAAA